jgi:tetratricopeptide (TPR) repeat protein
MNLFQVIMLSISFYFAYQIYLHVNNLKDSNVDKKNSNKRVSIVDPAYLVKRADEAYERGNYLEALKLLRDAHAKDKTDTEILNKLGFILAKNSDTDEAVEMYLKSLEINPQDDTVHNAIASVYRATNQFDKAKEHYEKALLIDDEYAVTYFNYANLLVDMQEIEKAKQMYKRAIEIDADFTQAKFELEKLK